MLIAKKKQLGFTIVELLIVIVVIGILALITVVAFNGIQSRARTAAVSSDLVGASKKLALYLIDNSLYPADLAALTAAGITTSPNTSFQYSVNNAVSPQTFCITATNSTTSYKITQATTPTSGGCAGHGVGGTAAVTNLSTNPRALSAGTGWSSNNSTILTVTKGVAITGHPLGIATAAMSQLAAGQVSTHVMSMYNTDTLLNSPTVRTGGVWVFVNASGYEACVYMSSGTCPGYTAININTWTYIRTPSPGSAYMSTFVRKTTGNAGASDVCYATGAIATTESAAPNFADGNSTDWVWNGAANNSTSTGPPQ